MNDSKSALLGLRLVSAAYDLFPLIALWMLTAGMFLLVAHGRIDVAHPPLLYRAALQAALLAVTAGYFVVSWSRGGQTIGMRAWRLELVADEGGALPWSRATLRFAVAIVSLSLLGAGFFWSLFDHRRRCWHDIAARSRLVRRPARS